MWSSIYTCQTTHDLVAPVLVPDLIINLLLHLWVLGKVLINCHCTQGILEKYQEHLSLVCMW